MNMSVLPILGSDAKDPEMRAALAAGWKRRDLWWERLQERANRDWLAGDRKAAVRGFRRAHWIACLTFPESDPRRATSLANAAFADRAAGLHGRAARRYAKARELWAEVPQELAALHVRPRSRSSLFHLRMEARHWDTYVENMRVRLARFIAESDAALRAIAAGDPSPHPLFARWRGERPPVFDDTRKMLAACLLLASETAGVSMTAPHPQDRPSDGPGIGSACND